MKINNAVESVNGRRLWLVKTWRRIRSLVLLFLSVAWLPALNAATVATDESDYAPYTLVSITGTGFQPGETINNQVVQVAGPAPGTIYAPWAAQADTNGNFTTSWLVFSDDLIGTTLQLTSIGQSSGLTASTTFSDSLTCPGLQTGIAPISLPSGGFGIDGDLVANAPAKGVGDWLPDSSGLGGVLDASGCPLNGLTTYHLLDAANSSLDNNYSSGKADDNPNNWTWSFSPVGSKVDLKHALIHTGRDANDHVWVVVGATRQSNNGDAYVDFEFLQNPLTVVTNAAGTGGSFSSAGPNGGRTINDFVLAITLTGGGTTPNLCVFRWNQVGVDGQGNPTYGYTNSTSVLPANSVFGAMNTAPVSIPNCYSNVVDTYAVNDFGEVAVDVTAMITGFDPCATESIGTIFVKSKQSQSPSAQLGDFITPQQVYQPIIIGPGAFAGLNQAKCVQGSSTSFTMAGSAQAGTLPLTSTNWTVVSGFATIDQPSSLTPTVTVYGAGTNVTLRLTVTDSGTCANSTQHSDVILAVNPIPSVTVNSPGTCAGSAATIKATVGIGTAPFAYAWTVPATVSNPGNVDHFSATVAGSYSVVITDANGCVSTSASGTLTVNPNPSVTVNSPATCIGSAATIQATVGIGTAPVAYAWTVPASVSNPGNVDHFSATVAGSYSVVVTDANGCTSASASGTLTLNPNPSVTVNSPTTCAGSEATIQATIGSGTGPFAYTWTVPATASNPGNVDHFSATVAGSYSVVVTDANGCTSASASGTLTVNLNPSVTVNSPATCAGSAATIQAIVSNGAGPFTYAWTVPAAVSDPGNVDHFSATVAGTYSVVVTGGQGCTSASASGTLTVNPIPSVTVNSPATCAGSATTIQATVSSGTGPFTYAWTVPATASNPGNMDHFSATVAGTYSVLVTDSKSCSSASASGTLTVNPPPNVSVNSPVACAGSGATIQATVSGGTAPFAYAWTVPATASNPGNVDHFSATVGGTYSVVVTDSKSCNSASGSGTLTVNPTPSLSAAAVQPACSTDTGSITASASGGTAPYMYSLDGTTFVASGTFSGLPGNTYTVTARDANGCTATKQLPITVPSTITLIATPNQPKCSTDTGSINASATGGTGTITYSKDGVIFQSSGSFTGLSAGMYSITAKDANGCNASMTVTINQVPPPMALSLITVQPVCSTDTGSITVSASGGTPGYTYSKDGVKFQTSGSFTGLGSGSCTITAKDANGCTCAQAVTIASPPAVSCAISGLSDVQLSATGNTITATANGGTPPYTFTWDCNDPAWTMTGTTDGSQSSTITYNAPADNDSAVFTVKTTDAHGCTAVCTLTVSCLPPSFVTDSSLCTFTSPFRLIFTQDPTNMPCFKLTASNPGQFYYNMTYLGAPGQKTATFYITLPYPFITQGASPIHAYDSVTIQNSGGQACLTPGNPIFVSKDSVTLDSYGPNPVVGVTKIVLAEKVPLSPQGYAYLNIHLDYGLKKAGGYTPGGPSGTDAVACSGSSVIPIPDLKADALFYNFGYTVGNVVVNTFPGVQSFNDFNGVAHGKPASSQTSVSAALPAGSQAQ